MRKTVLFMLLCTLALTAWAAPQRLAFILDASNSMNISLNGEPTRFTWAQEALTLVVNDLPADTVFAIAVFGHRIPSEEPNTCRDIELIASLGVHGEAERSALKETIAGLVAMGRTPLAESLRFIAARVPPPARIVLLTDGLDTCGGDPIAEARRLCARGYVVDVVGLALPPADEQALYAIATAGCGQFVPARDPADLPALLRGVAGIVVAPPPPAVPAIPPCLAAFKVDPAIVALLVKHLPYVPCVDSMWSVVLCFLERNPPARVIVGTDGDDVLFGTPGNDLILALGGNDQLHGIGGNDLLIAGPGDDLVQGGDGNDLILGGPGNDLLFGGRGDDTVYGEDGDDRIEGEAGNDVLFGGPCNDVILGGPGCNVIDGGPGKNFVYDEGTCPPRPVVAPPAPAKCPVARPTPPVCTVAPGVRVVDEGGSIVLTAKVHDPDCDKVRVTWSAPRGMFSDPNALETTYFAPWVKACEGEKIVITVVAVDACGATAKDDLVVHVRNVNRPPVVDAGPDLAVDEGGRIKLLASACDPDEDRLAFRWTIACGRGSLDNPHALQPIYTAPLTGHCAGETVELTLTVTDSCGAVVRDTVRVCVRNLNRPPWADAGPDLRVPEGGQIMITGKAGDPDGEKVIVSWWASAGTLSGADTLCPIFVAPDVPGCEDLLVTVTLRVVDPCGAVAKDTLVIRVFNVNRPPTVQANP